MSETFDAETGEIVRADLALREETAMLAPVVSPTEAKAAMKAYYELCEAVLDDADYQEFWQYDPAQKKKVKKRFKKKSAVKKLQTFWGVTVTAPDAIRDDLGDGHFAFRVRAIARKGNREVEAWGACSTMEERFDLIRKDDESDAAFDARQRKALARAYHDVLGTAETRATNRAVMNVIGVGGGEVTADEMGASRGQDRDESPPCPECGKQSSVIESKPEYGGGFYCFPKRGGCGAKWQPQETPVGAATANPIPSSGDSSGDGSLFDDAPLAQPPPRIGPQEKTHLIGLRERMIAATQDEAKVSGWVHDIVVKAQANYEFQATGSINDLHKGEEYTFVEKHLRAGAEKAELAQKQALDALHRAAAEANLP